MALTVSFQDEIDSTLTALERQRHKQAGAEHLEDAKTHLLDAMRNFALAGEADINPGIDLAIDVIADIQAKLTEGDE